MMLIRERTEAMEYENLAVWATKSMEASREVPIQECDFRTKFQRDRDRIIHSKAFRRLKHKTQVFIVSGDHYRTRMTHSLEVAQIARTIARSLRLNEDLTEAIALGHDMGHTPFGHAGERALDEICPLGFDHSKQSLRMVDVLEKDGLGLNLTMEVRDGILNHQTSGNPFTLEGKIVRLSDKIAYIHHDMDDAIRGGILTEDDVPISIREVIGYTTGERLDHFIHDTVTFSGGKNDILMSDEVWKAMKELREFMFERVYMNPDVKSEERKAESLMKTLYEYYLKHLDRLPREYLQMINMGESRDRVACDYVASMTDRYAIALYEELFIPKSWPTARY